MSTLAELLESCNLLTSLRPVLPPDLLCEPAAERRKIKGCLQDALVDKILRCCQCRKIYEYAENNILKANAERRVVKARNAQLQYLLKALISFTGCQFLSFATVQGQTLFIWQHIATGVPSSRPVRKIDSKTMQLSMRVPIMCVPVYLLSRFPYVR